MVIIYLLIDNNSMKYPFKKLLFLIFFLLLWQGISVAGNYEMGRRYYIQRKYSLAREFLQKAVEENPNNGDAFFFLGEVEKDEGNYEKAADYYQKAIARPLTRKFVKLARWNIIVLTEKRGNYYDMVKASKATWKRTGDYGAKSKVESIISKSLWTDNKEAIELYNKGMDHKRHKRPEEAMAAFREALTKEPGFLAAKFEIGMDLYTRGDVDGAAGYFQEIVAKVPFYGDLHLLLGDIYYNKKDYSRAVEHFNLTMDYSFIKKDTEYLIFIKRAKSYFNLKSYEKSEKDIESALAIKPGGIEPLSLLSAVYIIREKYPEALKTLHKLDSLNPKNAEVKFRIGSIQYKQNDERYVHTFDNLFDIIKGEAGSENLPKKYFKAMEILARKLFEKKKYPRAAAVIDILPSEMKDKEIQTIAAKCYYHTGQYVKAIPHYEKLYLTSDDSLELCIAYAMGGMKDKSKGVVYRFMKDTSFMNKAGKSEALKGILKEIAEEQKKDKEKQNTLEKKNP